MITQEQRLKMMHKRAMELRKQRERRTTALLSVSSLMVMAGLFSIMAKINVSQQIIDNNGYTGSSLLASEAGGYVLVGVLSFAEAVVITVICMKLRNKK